MSPMCQLSFPYCDTSTKCLPESYILCFLNSLFLDLLIQLFTYAYVCVCMCASLYGGLKLAMDVYLNGLPPYFLRQGSLTGLDQLAMGPRDPPSPAPQGWDCRYVGCTQCVIFTWVLAIKPRSPCLRSWHRTIWAIPLATCLASSSLCSNSLRQLEKILASQKWVHRLTCL